MSHVDVKAAFKQKQKLRKRIQRVNTWRRLMYYSPADMLDHHLIPGKLAVGYLVFVNSGWQKVVKEDEEGLVTTSGIRLRYGESPNDDFMFKEPTEFNGWLINLAIGALSMLVAGLGLIVGIVALVVSLTR